ncbi:MAG TPA: Flp family type IVb pilin [bacterium]|nr:Flp family type IVb pilin [bacterium]HOC25942.1 Flp family type IVb pilin [bacterium]HOH06575.1 Flp family type IVb pilin [bacterium]
MQILINIFRSLFVREEGQTLAEYALILFLIAIAAVAVLGALGVSISGIFQQIIGAL